jgi:hypothetical protein
VTFSYQLNYYTGFNTTANYEYALAVTTGLLDFLSSQSNVQSVITTALPGASLGATAINCTLVKTANPSYTPTCTANGQFINSWGIDTYSSNYLFADSFQCSAAPPSPPSPSPPPPPAGCPAVRSPMLSPVFFTLRYVHRVTECLEIIFFCRSARLSSSSSRIHPYKPGI